MATSVDVFVTALQALMPGYTTTFDVFNPAFEKIVDRGNRKRAKGRYVEFILTPSGPGQTYSIEAGDEYLAAGRKMESVRANEAAAQLVHVWSVPNKDFREVDGEADIGRLIADYPERALLEFQQDLGEQFVMGGKPGYGQFPTLNGDQTYNPSGYGSRSGWIEFAAPASQTGVVHGQSKATLKGWQNQYRHITSMKSNGRRTLYAAFDDASQQGARRGGNVDVMLADRESWDRYQDVLVDQIRLIKPESSLKQGDTVRTGVREGIAVRDGVMYPEPLITVADFTTANAQLGVIYGLHTGSIALYTLGVDQGGTKPYFGLEGPLFPANQDVTIFKYVLAMGMYNQDLRRNFAVTGGTNP